jgi:enediyne polyketide synthase
VADAPEASSPGQSVAIVGLACRFPDADDPAALLDAVLTGRRAFRRLPRCRVDLAEYYSADPLTPDATYSTRAAVLEGWQFDRSAFKIPAPAYFATDAAHWLALETAARALAGAGFPGGAGLARDRVGVIIGNTLAGDTSRASALRMRWPYVRSALAEALLAAELDGQDARQVLRHAAAHYLAPFPRMNDGSLAGSTPAAIASIICGYFGFRGGGVAVDGACASSLLAVASACAALTSGDLDVALAGGVDLSLDPLELVGLAKAGVLATDHMRVYDENPTGFLPGEGCGVVVLMRTADARAADLPIHAEVAGWGSSAAGQLSVVNADPGSQLLALRRAYERAGVDPADVQLIEGHGSGTAAGDEAELTALADLRAGAHGVAALGSVKANIGHAKAAAGAAGLIKTVLAMSTGVIPPATGCDTPHRLLRDDDARMRLPRSAEQWPEGTRHAGVSAMGLGGLSVHLVLRSEPDRASRPGRMFRVPPDPRRAGSGPAPAAVLTSSQADGQPARPLAYLLHAADRHALAAALARVADVAPWLSDAELRDLACQFASEAKAQGPARMAIVASGQEQLGRLARDAIALLPGLTVGLLTVRPGIFAADRAEGRVTLLLAEQETSAGPDAIGGLLSLLRWLDQLGVHASAAVGEGIGQLAGLAWAACLSDADAIALASLRAEFLDGLAADEAGARSARQLREAAARFSLGPPRRRLISAITGRDLTSADAAAELLRGELVTGLGSASRLAEALTAAAAGASLLLATGSGGKLAAAASRFCRVPVVTIGTGQGEDADPTPAIAALFAAGALAEPGPLFADHPGRPIDIWRDQTFIVSPCQAMPGLRADASAPPEPLVADHADPGRPADPARPAGPARPATAGTGRAAGTGRTGDISRAADRVTGVAAWVRCYAEELRPTHRPMLPVVGGAWRVRVAGTNPFRMLAEELFADDPDAGRVLTLIGADLDPQTCATALHAARDAISTGRLVVITHGPGMPGFWASLHAEHPSLGITVLRVPASAEGLRKARRYAAAEPGEFRELVIDTAGRPREPVMAPTVPRIRGAFPLGPDDVVLVSRGAGGAGLALAQVLACCGAPVAVLGRPGPDEDGEVVAGLERLRSAGARVAYEVIDIADQAALGPALRRIERRLGPVTAIGHAAGSGAATPVIELTGAQLHAKAAEAAAALTQLVSAVRTDRLRLIATFGSVAGRYGMAGESLLALASGSLAERAERLADGIAGCRALHVDWPAWAGADLGQRAGLAEDLERAGITPIPIAAGARLLLKLLATPGLPARLAVHGRVGRRAPAAIRAGQPQSPWYGRFTETTRVHYPGVELVCEARLSLRTDPYLADYRMDGMPVLPPAMALEAMAQAASVLAGRPMRRATEVSMDAPVVIPAGAADRQVLIRICALRDSGAVQVVLRCEESRFGVDHFRAAFCCDEEADRAMSTSPPARSSGSGELPADRTGIVDGAELYGPTCFQSGRFRRVAILPEVTARSCRALARGADEQPWFGAGGGQDHAAAGGLVLGSPAISDAALQAVQACVPHRRLLPTGCESVTFSGERVDGTVKIRAVAVRDATPSAPSSAIMVPRQAGASDGQLPLSGAGAYIWDVEAVDSAGRPLVTWRRLRFRDIGQLPRGGAWPAALLSAYLERSAAALGLDPSLRVAVECARPAATPAELTARPRFMSSLAMAGAGQLAGFTLRVRSADAVAPAACAWAAVRPAHEAGPDADPRLAEVRAQLRQRLAEPSGTLAARMRAIADCLTVAATPADCQVTLRLGGGDWALLNVAGASLACTVIEISGVPCPVAIAIMTGQPRDTAGPPAARGAAPKPQLLTVT